jgi:hypothetical protein
MGFEQLICLDDEAIAKARMVDGYDIELRSSDRFVVRLTKKE